MHKLYDCSYPNVALFFKTKLFSWVLIKKKTRWKEKSYSSESVEA